MKSIAMYMQTRLPLTNHVLHVNIVGSATNVPITKDVINAARITYSEYKLYLEEQQRIKAEELQKTVEA